MGQTVVYGVAQQELLLGLGHGRRHHCHVVPLGHSAVSGSKTTIIALNCFRTSRLENDSICNSYLTDSDRFENPAPFYTNLAVWLRPLFPQFFGFKFCHFVWFDSECLNLMEWSCRCDSDCHVGPPAHSSAAGPSRQAVVRRPGEVLAEIVLSLHRILQKTNFGKLELSRVASLAGQ